MKIPDRIRSLFDRYEIPRAPVVFFRDTVYSLTSEVEDLPHTFGGRMPSCLGIGSPAFHRLVLTLNTDFLSAMSSQESRLPSVLPLIFNFDLGGLTTDYVIEGTTLRFAHRLCIFGPWKPGPDSQLPYEPYPDFFPEVKMGLGISARLEFQTFQRLFTPQGLSGSSERPDIADHLFVIVPPCKDFRISMWGEDGDSEGVLCIFDYDLSTGKVDVTNQCT